MSNRILKASWIFFAIAALLTGCGRKGIVLTEGSDSATRAIVAGDINRIDGGLFGGENQAKVPPGYYYVSQGIGEVDEPFDSQNSEILGLGDYYALSGDNIGKARIISQPVLANFIVGIPPRSNPTATYQVKGPIPLSEALLETVTTHGSGETIAVLGLCEFDDLYGSRKGKSVRIGKRQAIFFAVVDARPGRLDGEVGQIFNGDKRDMSRDDMNVLMTYGLFPDRSRPDLRNLNATAGKITDVGRLFSQSIVKSGTLQVYEVKVESPN